MGRIFIFYFYVSFSFGILFSFSFSFSIFQSSNLYGGEFQKIKILPKIIRPGEPFTVYYTPTTDPHDSVHDSVHDKEKISKVFIHYGFNGWKLPFYGNSRSKNPQSKGHVQSISSEEEMIWEKESSNYKITLTAPQGIKSFHMVFHLYSASKVNQEYWWDNNNGQDYSWPIQFPYIGPILTWNEKTKPDTGIVISFENSFPAKAWIEMGPQGPHFLSKKIKISTPTYQYFHHFTFTSLRPNTTYSYRVGIDDFKVSPYYTFTTAPALENIKEKKISFILFGDAQDDGQNGHFSRVIQNILNQENDALFILSTGDLTYNDNPGNWWIFFDKAKELLARKVFMPAVGNHDTPYPGPHENADSFLKYFKLPHLSRHKTYYDFSLGPLKFFALNTDRPHELNKKNGLQYDWLKRELSARKQEIRSKKDETLWTFAYWHVPPLNLGKRHYQEGTKTLDLTTLFNGVIDWQLGGHEHLYQRTFPLNISNKKLFKATLQEKYGTRPNQGVGYLIVPAAGIRSDSSVLPENHLYWKRLSPLFASLPIREESKPSIGYVRINIDLSSNSFGLSTSMENFDFPFLPFSVIDSLNYTK